MKDNNCFKPLISIIVPLYNTPKDLFFACIDSVTNQSYKNWELIVIDDGSSNYDESAWKKVIKKDDRIIVIHQSNLGVSASRNKGIVCSRGEYITFIDSDDWIDMDFLNTFIQRIEMIDYDICICGALVEKDNDTIINEFYNRDIIKCDASEKYEFQSQLICRGISKFYPPIVNIGVPWGKVYKKSFLIEKQLYFKQGIKRMEDNLFNLYAFKEANNISYINKRMYHYRKLSTSTSGEYCSSIINDFRPFLNELENFVVKEKNDQWIQGANKRRITSINSYMKSFFFHPHNGVSFSEKIRSLKEFISTREIVNASNNVNKSILNIQEKTFFFFVKKKNAFGLFITFKLKEFIG